MIKIIEKYLTIELIRHLLNNVIENYGFCPRRKVDLIIRYGKVLVNGSLAQIGMEVNPNLNNIYMNGKALKNLNSQSNTILFHKSKNVITTCLDNHNRNSVIDLQRVYFANIAQGNIKEGTWELIN